MRCTLLHAYSSWLGVMFSLPCSLPDCTSYGIEKEALWLGDNLHCQTRPEFRAQMREGMNATIKHYSVTAVTRKTAHKKTVTADLDFK